MVSLTHAAFPTVSQRKVYQDCNLTRNTIDVAFILLAPLSKPCTVGRLGSFLSNWMITANC